MNISILPLLILISFAGVESINDADGDGIVDQIDTDTFYGYLEAPDTEGHVLNLCKMVDGHQVIVGTVTTDQEGYWAFGGLEEGHYDIIPQFVEPDESDMVTDPVPRYWFYRVCRYTGYDFDYYSQADHDKVWELLRETFAGGK